MGSQLRVPGYVRELAIAATLAYFDEHYERLARENPLLAWQLLCRDIGVPVEDNVKDCKRVWRFSTQFTVATLP